MAKAPVTLPASLAKVAEASNQGDVQWFIFQVQSSLDWFMSLDGARLRLTPEPMLQAPNSSKELKITKGHASLGQLLLLKPDKPGSYKMGVEDKVKAIVEIVEAKQTLQEADRAAGKAEKEEKAAERKKLTLHSRLKSEAARKRDETRKRCEIPPLLEVFENFGLPTEKFQSILDQDSWTGKGPDPGAGLDGTAEPDEVAEEGEEIVYHLKCFRKDNEPGTSMPILNWRLSALDGDGQSQLTFRHYMLGDKGSKSQFICQFQDAKSMILHGNKARRTSQSELRHLVGAKAPNSKRVFLCEADMYYVERQRSSLAATATGGDSDYEVEQVRPDELDSRSYMEKRNELTTEFGIAKRVNETKKMQDKGKKRVFQEIEEYSTELTERAESLEENLVDIQERSEAARRKLLPTYDADAVEPHKIYQVGLQDIVPKRMMEEEACLKDAGLAEFIQRVSKEPLRANEVNEYTKKSKLLAAVISARGRNGASPLEEKEAMKVAMKCEVLRKLIRLYRMGGKSQHGVYKVKNVTALCELAQDSSLAYHWHNTYYDEVPNGGNMRSFNGKKLLPALVIWALYLTPGLQMEVNLGEIEAELGMFEGLRKTCENVGCTVEKMPQPEFAAVTTERYQVKLAHPPRLDLELFKIQNMIGPASKKKSRGRGRGRG